MTERSAGAVIFRREKGKNFYLLLHYGSGHWDFSKGKIEKGESKEGAARREVFEETGIRNIDFIPGFKETIRYFYKREKEKISKTVVFFLAQTTTKKVKISWEHKAYKWLAYKEASKQLTYKNAKEILKKANNFLQ